MWNQNKVLLRIGQHVGILARHEPTARNIELAAFLKRLAKLRSQVRKFKRGHANHYRGTFRNPQSEFARPALFAPPKPPLESDRKRRPCARYVAHAL